ncbi:hypothetical protein F2Q70_00027562 [Brassica cretica]|uniref:Uncharacterized protein n=1 Tax=Brassica cretica TaxID=69181 RepID=A0A8S9LBU5_BRACR|nr:hypothetical protein F2Q70_00027562 [Brassica cretica]
MIEGTKVTLRIHFGGIMEKAGETYKYKGELGVNTMSEGTKVTLRIHFGGIMEKARETYKYKGELGVNTVSWEFYDILWRKFLKFCWEDACINAPVRFIWFKEFGKEMKTVNYVFE